MKIPRNRCFKGNGTAYLPFVIESKAALAACVVIDDVIPVIVHVCEEVDKCCRVRQRDEGTGKGKMGRSR